MMYRYATAVSADIEGQLRLGMTKPEVLDIAGPPYYKSEDDPAVRIHHDTDTWLYSVRKFDGFGVYSDPLRVKFKDGRCVEAVL